jgi:hypothetical protein
LSKLLLQPSAFVELKNQKLGFFNKEMSGVTLRLISSKSENRMIVLFEGEASSLMLEV